MDRSLIRIPEAVSEAFQSGNGAIWLGAGTSIGSGLPTWRSLIESMSRFIVEESGDESFRASEYNFLEIAQIYRSLVGENAYFSFLRREILGRRMDVIGSEENKVLESVCSFVNHFWPKPGVTVVTTNYDSLIEECLYVNHGKRARAIVEKDDIAAIGESDGLCVLKPHGDIRYPDSIVSTVSDYCSFREGKSQFIDLMKDIFLKKTVLFVGYGLRDFTINSIIGELYFEYGFKSRSSFLLTTEHHPHRRSVLASIGVKCIGMPSYDSLPFVLDAIAKSQPYSSVRTSESRDLESLKGCFDFSEFNEFLIVDDDKLYCELLRGSIGDLKVCSVDFAFSGREAREMMERKSYDVIFFDQILPDASGVKLIEEARRSTNNSDALMIAVSSEVRAVDAMRFGADLDIQKPIEPVDLLAKVAMLCNLRKRTGN